MRLPTSAPSRYPESGLPVLRGLNLTERAVAQRMVRNGWDILRKGWPDFLAFRDGKVICVEVKREGQHLKPAQRLMAEALLKCGIQVWVAHVSSKGQVSLTRLGL